MNVKFPITTPYIGIGYGREASQVKGWGFYADLGAKIGTFDIDVTTRNVVGTNGITQADVDKQAQDMRDAGGDYSVLPSFSLGATYRF